MILNELQRATGLERNDLEDRVHCEPGPYRAAAAAHAIAVITEWDEFKGLDFERIYRGMHKPAFAFDGRNILPHGAMREIGCEVHAIGKCGLPSAESGSVKARPGSVRESGARRRS